MIEIRLLFIPNAFKRQADDNDHHRVCVEGKFRRPVAPLYQIGMFCSGSEGV